MSIINTTKLSEFSTQLWNKIMTKTNSFLNKNEDSFVGGRITFREAYILGAKICSIANPRATKKIANDTSYFTCESLTIPANTKINKVTIGIDENKNFGDIITGVNIGFAKASNKEVIKYSMQGGTAVVHKNSDNTIPCEKVITITLNETFNENVIIMVGGNGVKWGDRQYPYGGQAVGGGTLPDVGSSLRLNTSNYIGHVIVYASDLSINDLFERINQITPPNPTNSDVEELRF